MDQFALGAGRAPSASSQTLLRLVAAGRPDTWLGYECHGVESGTFYSRDWPGDPGLSGRFWLDRANVKLSAPLFDLTLGRQAVNFAKAYFWNPLDVFLPFDPRQFDREYKPGVDAARLDIPLSSFSGINLVGAVDRETDASGNFQNSNPLRGAPWTDQAFLARVYTTLWGWDLALQSGKIFGGSQTGLGLAGELGPVALRLEAAHFTALPSGMVPGTLSTPLAQDHTEAVAGWGYHFSQMFDLEGEYFYNGAGLPEDMSSAALRVASGKSLQMGRHLGGLIITSELHPLLNAQLGWIYSFSDGGSAIQPSLRYSISDESDFLFGATINKGARPFVSPALALVPGSEFGSSPDIYFMEYKFYF
jgi:hypothetical protein